MSRLKAWVPVLLAVAFVGAMAWAANEKVDQGQPGNQGPWPVTITNGGFADGGIPVVPQNCTLRANKSTTVSTSAGNTPSSQMAGREYLVLCNSLQNSGTPLVKCRVDGTSPVMAVTNPGDVLGVGDCITYTINASITASCISDGATTYVTSFECG